MLFGAQRRENRCPPSGLRGAEHLDGELAGHTLTDRLQAEHRAKMERKEDARC